MLNKNLYVLRVTDEDTLSVELLRCRVIGGLCIRKGTGLQVLDVHLDGERLVGWDGVQVGRAGELAEWHVRLRNNITHWDGVA